MKFLGYLILSLSLFTSCNANKMILEKNQLELLTATYEIYNPGIESGDQGYTLRFVLLSDDITLEEIYFKQKTSKLKKVNDTLFTGFLQTKSNKEIKPIFEGDNSIVEQKEDVELKENTYSKFDALLNADEAILKCNINTKTKYYKVKMTEKRSLIQPM